MAMKPVPKLILIVAVVGGIGYAVNHFVTLPKAPTAPVAEAPSPVIAAQPAVQPVQASVAAPQSEPVPEPAVRPTQDPSVDRGLNNLLRNR
jgi:Rieske Fe-S protein